MNDSVKMFSVLHTFSLNFTCLFYYRHLRYKINQKSSKKSPIDCILLGPLNLSNLCCMADRSFFHRSGQRLLPVLFAVASVLDSLAQNPIIVENAQPGNPIAEWGVPNFRDNRIAGFSTRMSLNSGETVRFKISVEAGATYALKIYRLGYYGGNGARLIQNLGLLNGVVQPAGISDPVTGILDCGNWSESASWTIPRLQFRAFTLQSWREREEAAIILHLLFAMMPAIQICICRFPMQPGRHTMDTEVIQCMMAIPVFPMATL